MEKITAEQIEQRLKHYVRLATAGADDTDAGWLELGPRAEVWRLFGDEWTVEEMPLWLAELTMAGMALSVPRPDRAKLKVLKGEKCKT